MQAKQFLTGLALATTMLSVTLLVTGAIAFAQTETVIHSFDVQNGGDPYAGLIFDSSGNLYGTTLGGGGGSSLGTVFELTPKTGVGWTENILHRFTKNGVDGYNPYAGLIFDSLGNLYGTTEGGGAHGDAGVVFELSPKPGGGWTEKILHSFNNNGTDGYILQGGVILDSSGNLYGTTVYGGTYGDGVVYELTPNVGGGWHESILHNFGNNATFRDGEQPSASLILDSSGHLYGTTVYGGSGTCDNSTILGCGTVFELTPKAGGGWHEQILHSFQDDGTDGQYPYASLIFDRSGNLYGTTLLGGKGEGAVFELTPKLGGGWAESVLYNFGNGTDGYQPRCSLIFDASGNLYGTTSYGNGTVFELTPTASGPWSEITLHAFTGRHYHDGTGPYSNLTFDASGNLYGTTTQGGSYGTVNYGTVFEITP